MPPRSGGWQRNWIHRGAPRPANPVTCFPPGKVVAPVTKGEMHFRRPQDSCKGFSRQRRHKKWRQKRRTSPAGTVSQPIGKPFNGQAKGLLWLTWRSYAGPPQYIYLPRAEARSPSGRRQSVPDRTFGAQGQRPGGVINPHARKGRRAFGNTEKHRPGPDPDRATGACP